MTFALFRGYCGVDEERIIEPRQRGPAGGGWMKSDVGHRKYVLVKDMAVEKRFKSRWWILIPCQGCCTLVYLTIFGKFFASQRAMVRCLACDETTAAPCCTNPPPRCLMRTSFRPCRAASSVALSYSTPDTVPTRTGQYGDAGCLHWPAQNSWNGTMGVWILITLSDGQALP